MSEIILITKNELRNLIKEVLIEHDAEKASKLPEKLLTINKVAKMLGKSHATIKKYVDNGTIKTTKNGFILPSSINEFLSQ